MKKKPSKKCIQSYVCQQKISNIYASKSVRPLTSLFRRIRVLQPNFRPTGNIALPIKTNPFYIFRVRIFWPCDSSKIALVYGRPFCLFSLLLLSDEPPPPGLVPKYEDRLYVKPHARYSGVRAHSFFRFQWGVLTGFDNFYQ